MNTISISRRKFAQLLTAGAAAAVVRPRISLAAEPAPRSTITSGLVRLSSNENPYGPSPKAFKAMTDAFALACRYPDEQNILLIDALAKLNGVAREQILLGDGSGEILKVCAAAFTGPMTRDKNRSVTLRPLIPGGPPRILNPGRGKLVVADPTFEAVVDHATVCGTEIVKVPLTRNFGHDLAKMSAAAKEGLVYICNPNNPTATITPKKEVREFIAKTPRETMILVDEAYFHYTDSADYESVIPLIKDHPNLIVARTFSKIYGMAGLRCGYCVAQPPTIEQMRPHECWDSVSTTALAAALGSLDDAEQVANGRRLNSEAKAFLTGELDTMGYKQIPSQANFVMIDLKRQVQPLIDAMKLRGVEVGRLFPALPNHMRVTIGKKAEMETFLSVLRQVIA